jgi:hypothetical protein
MLERYSHIRMAAKRVLTSPIPVLRAGHEIAGIFS